MHYMFGVAAELVYLRQKTEQRKDGQCIHNVTFWHVYITTVAI
jgi:hypothetical protein